MHLLYLDDAGSVQNRQENHFILAGIAVFERQVHWLQSGLDRLAQRLGHPQPARLEFHGNPMVAGRGWWRSLKLEQRRAIIREGLLTALTLQGEWALFGVVVDKRALAPEDPVRYAFEQLCSRFDRYLMRLYHHNQENPQRGIIILDKATQETELQSLASELKITGNRWGNVIRNLVDVPFFVDSRATRLVQYADLVSYALWRKFEKNDDEFFNAISSFFDSADGNVHGLHHYRSATYVCDCPGCISRY